MPVSTPNRVADPVLLESYSPPAIIRHSDDLSVSYYNPLATSILQGEPVVIGGRVGLAQSVILPGTVGTVVMDWIADFRVNPSLAANILQNDTVWWDYDIVSVVAGVGSAARAAPTNGFILGLAIVQPGTITLSSGKAIACAPGDTYVRVISNAEPVVAIGTIPLFNG
jgi:Uncharacterized conserved protein (DUF2190)